MERVKNIENTKARTEYKKRKVRADWTVLLLTYMLVVIGLLMVYSSSSIQAQFDPNANYDSMYYLKRQFIYVIMGTIALFVCYAIDYRLYKKLAIPIYILNIVLLIMTKYSFLRVEINEAHRWLNLGFMTFQTSDFSKVATIIIVAYYVSLYKNEMKKFRSILVPLFLSGLTFLLICVQPSFSAGLIVLIETIAMLFIGGMSLFHTMAIMAFGVVGAIVIALSKSYRIDRLTSYLNPFEDTTGGGYQIVNSILAIASGNIWGVGYGKSTQKYFYIPQPQNDFIFSIFAEEFGLVGCIILIAIYFVLIYRIFSLFMSLTDTFAKMMVAGIGLLIGVQMFLHIAVVSGVVPNTGIGLPFISYGGTSMIMFLSMIGMLLNISRHRKVYKG